MVLTSLCSLSFLTQDALLLVQPNTGSVVGRVDVIPSSRNVGRIVVVPQNAGLEKILSMDGGLTRTLLRIGKSY